MDHVGYDKQLVLGVLRGKAFVRQEFCTPIKPGDSLTDLHQSLRRNYENFLYIAKNMVYMYYCTNNSTGETDSFFILLPKACVLNESAPLTLISKESIDSAPFTE